MGTWISRIAEKVNNSIDSVVSPAPTLPPLLLLCEIMNRPGMSSIRLASNIIARLPEIGVDNGKNKDGSDNVVNLFTKVLCDELIKEIQTNSVVDSVVKSGSISFTGIGANAAGPVVVKGSNVTQLLLKGLVR